MNRRKAHKKRRAAKVKACVMWTLPAEVADTRVVPVLMSRKPTISGDAAYLVIPFDPASREALVEQVAQEIRDWTTGRAESIWASRAALAILHPDFAKEGGR